MPESLEPLVTVPDVIGRDVIVIGAGVAGLACAASLQKQGATVVLLDKGRGVGGRCATRRLVVQSGATQPVDHGVAFFHGEDPEFLAALAAVDATPLTWPRTVSGGGAPCNPAAFAPTTLGRLSFAEGVNRFPKHLARGLDVRLGVTVRQLRTGRGRFEVYTEQGTFEARDVVLTLPPAQAAALTSPLATPGQPAAAGPLTGATALMSTLHSHPCQTLIVQLDGADPETSDADVIFPETGPLQLISHDSRKRPAPRGRVLVLQARASWSAANLDLGLPELSRALLEAAARELGPRLRSPLDVVAHRWRYARVEAGFVAPYLAELDGGARLGLCGESFDRAGGVEGAWRSGRRLAARIGVRGAYG